MHRAAAQAVRPLVRDFGEISALQPGSRQTLRAYARRSRLRVFDFLHQTLCEHRPGTSVLSASENGGLIAGKNDAAGMWLISPLVGERNFLRAVPHFAISVAFLRRGVVEGGMVLDPLRNEVFSAERGTGAFCNNQRLRVCDRRGSVDVLCAGSDPRSSLSKGFLHPEDSASESGNRFFRSFGCLALDLAYVASGRLDACWASPVSSWEAAAGLLLVREAGGNVLPREAVCAQVHEPLEVIAGTRTIFDQIVEARDLSRCASAETPKSDSL